MTCTFGNGLKDTREYDLQGRLTRQVLKDPADFTIDERAYTYDKNSNILAIDTGFEDNAYTYDKLDRVVGDTVTGNPDVDATPINFSYDLNDNRLSRDKTDLSEVNGYEYLDASNRLISKETFSLTGPSPIQERDRELVYNDAGRLFQLFENGALKAEYVYNDEGQRTRKVTYAPDGLTVQAITIFHYDHRGYLITETEETGQLIRDYIWTETMHPVAQIDSDGTSETISYLYTDHLMTNRLATDEFQQVIWRWEGEAFGNTEAQEFAGISINLRFPGQYFDQESNLYYNWHRYYDPELGRYITSDPIGLNGGINTYAYALQNPARFIDPRGLDVIPVPPPAPSALECGVDFGCPNPVTITFTSLSAPPETKTFSFDCLLSLGFVKAGVLGISGPFLKDFLQPLAAKSSAPRIAAAIGAGAAASSSPPGLAFSTAFAFSEISGRCECEK